MYVRERDRKREGGGERGMGVIKLASRASQIFKKWKVLLCSCSSVLRKFGSIQEEEYSSRKNVSTQRLFF